MFFYSLWIAVQTRTSKKRKWNRCLHWQCRFLKFSIIFQNIFERHQLFLWGHWQPYFGILLSFLWGSNLLKNLGDKQSSQTTLIHVWFQEVMGDDLMPYCTDCYHLRYGLFTLHGNGIATVAGNWTRTIANSRSLFPSLSHLTSVNISVQYIGGQLIFSCRFYRITRELKKSKMLTHWELSPGSSDFQVLHVILS